MRVNVLFFAGAREVVGSAELSMELDAGCTARAFVDVVCARFPGLDAYRGALRVAIDGAYADWDDALRDGAEIAIIPPVAGG